LKYEKGIGVDQSDAEAANWYRQAAQDGKAAGQAGLGTFN